MTRKRSRAVIVRALGCVAVSALLSGPVAAVTIRGHVIDKDKGSALPGATVTIQGTNLSATADRDGNFAIADAPDGPQTLVIDYVGYAEATQPAGAEPVEIALAGADAGEVVVTGNRLAERRALQTKRAADNFVEALYANDVGKLPDQNVAEAIRRLPGISVANDQGEGRYVIIRGIDPSLINVTLNNQTLPAPEPDGRQVKLDDIPSAMIASVVVSKSLTPDLDANAIGGEVAIKTLTAFDVNKSFFLNARGAYGWYNINHKDPYEVDGQAGGVFGSDGQFGAVLSVNYSRRPIESENFQGSEAWDPINGLVVPDQAGLRDYNLVRTRTGIVGNFDWHPSADAKIYLRTSYSKFTDNEFRDQNILTTGAAGTFTNQTATGGTFVGASSIKMRRRREDDNTRSALLGGSFNVGASTLELSGSYARAVKTDPLRSEFTFNGPSATVDYDLTGSPYKFVARGNIFDDPSLFTFNKVNFDHRRAVEQLWQGRADFTLPIDLGDDSSIKVGAKYLDRHKTNDEESLAYKKGSTAWKMTAVGYVGDTDFYDGEYHFGERVDYDAARAFVNANPGVVKLDTAGSIASSLSGDYDVREKIASGYAMATLKWGGLTVIPGVRVEHTHDANKAKIVGPSSTLTDGYNVSGGTSYTDWFPGLNAKYAIDDNMLVRGAVTTSLGRPNYPDLAPYVVVEDDTVPGISLGNPDLKPYKAVNLDASLEYYLPSQGVLSVGLFYKHIDNPIYPTTDRVANGTFGGVVYPLADVTKPVNADDETVKGVELNAQAQFTFLPGILSGFGLSANYTHVSGHAHAAIVRAGNIPLLFQSNDIGTVQLFYEKYGLAARVAFSYRSKYLDAVGGTAAEDQYTDGNGQLDVHMSYQISKQFTVFADGTNLTDAPWRRFIGTKQDLIERERYDFSVRGGVQLHF